MPILTHKLPALCLFFCLLLCHACEKIELPSDNSGSNNSGGNGGGSVIAPDGILTPTQVLHCPADTIVCVRGYIVGYVGGTSLSRAVFGLPTDAPNTNMLLADTPDEQEISRCLVVELSKNNKDVPREALNLYDHPEHYKRAIMLEGLVREYFKTTGLRDLYYYEWCETLPDDGKDDNPDDPDNPENPDDDIPTPGMDDTPEVIPDGR